ncbi:hypothetical protein ACA910_011246 [Epithemia clementina (nom. ined.)]
MKAITGVANTAFLGFFASHILATVVIDSQAVLPDAWIPQGLQNLLKWYATSFNDPLMGNAKNLLWFQSLVWLELLFQLPFFVWACSILLAQKTTAEETYPERFRYACIAYGGHASTSMVPILVALATNEGATVTERITILSVYIPYLIFPIILLWFAIADRHADKSDKKTA